MELGSTFIAGVDGTGFHYISWQMGPPVQIFPPASFPRTLSYHMHFGMGFFKEIFSGGGQTKIEGGRRLELKYCTLLQGLLIFK